MKLMLTTEMQESVTHKLYKEGVLSQTSHTTNGCQDQF